MRLLLCLACSVVLAMAATRGTIGPAAAQPTELTIVLDFEGPPSEESLGEMKRELASIMRGSGLVFDWRLRSEIKGSSFSDLILVKMKGHCGMEPSQPVPGLREPLASAHRSGEMVLPFADVHCDAVSFLVRSAAEAGGRKESNLLLGRALGRVLAHELCHILGNTFAHGDSGVSQTSLSGEQLISLHLGLDPVYFERLRARTLRSTRSTD
jgi:hypothetical protein